MEQSKSLINYKRLTVSLHFLIHSLFCNNWARKFSFSLYGNHVLKQHFFVSYCCNFGYSLLVNCVWYFWVWEKDALFSWSISFAVTVHGLLQSQSHCDDAGILTSLAVSRQNSLKSIWLMLLIHKPRILYVVSYCYGVSDFFAAQKCSQKSHSGPDLRGDYIPCVIYPAARVMSGMLSLSDSCVCTGKEQCR